MSNNNTCKKCGKTLDSPEQEICFDCWLSGCQEKLEKEQNSTSNSTSNHNHFEITPTKNRRFELKNIFLNVIGVLCILIIFIATFFDMKNFFLNFINLTKKIGNGNFIIGIMILPLAFWGAIQLFRGFCEMCDNGKINSTLSIILTIVGYIVLFYTLSLLPL